MCFRSMVSRHSRDRLSFETKLRVSLKKEIPFVLLTTTCITFRTSSEEAKKRSTTYGCSSGVPLKHRVPSKGTVVMWITNEQQQNHHQKAATHPLPAHKRLLLSGRTRPRLVRLQTGWMAWLSTQKPCKPHMKLGIIYPLKGTLQTTLFALLHKKHVFLWRITPQFSPITLLWESIYQMRATSPPETLETVQFFTLFH